MSPVSMADMVLCRVVEPVVPLLFVRAAAKEESLDAGKWARVGVESRDARDVGLDSAEELDTLAGRLTEGAGALPAIAR